MTLAPARTLVYRYQDGAYVNLTNRCPTACRFCIKFTWKMRYRSYDLKLNNLEPSVPEILEALGTEWARKPFSEVVYCGYGESTYRLEEMKAVSAAVGSRWPKVQRRLNTIGLGDLICGRPIALDLAGALDSVSVSLNTADPAQWAQIHNPLPEFQEDGFEAVLSFIRSCARAIPDTAVTAVERPDVDIPAVRRTAESLGARYRERPWLDEYEDK